MMSEINMDKHFEYAGVDAGDSSDTSGGNSGTTDTGVTADVTTDTNGTGTESGTSTETQSTAAASSEVKGDVGKDSVGSPTDGGKEQKPAAKGKDTANPGDLVLTDGTRIKAGAERRLYEQANVARQEVKTVRGQLDQATAQVQKLQGQLTAVNDTVKQIGLENPAAVQSAVRLHKDLHNDPVGTVTKLLAELQGKGYKIEGLGSAVDNALLQSINQRLNATVEQPSREQVQEQLQEQVQNEVNTFLNTFPDAHTHSEMLANVVEAETKAGRNISLQDAYFRLKNAAAHHGFDWSQPLEPQMAARKSQTTQQPNTQPQPVPGRPGVIVATTENINPLKSPNNSEDTDSIILAAMAENGIAYKR